MTQCLWSATSSSSTACPAYQKVVQAGAIYAQEFSRFCNLEREDLILADLADKYGMQINEVSADARAEMAKVAQPAVIKLVAKDIGQDAVDQYMNDVKDVLAQISSSDFSNV